MSLLFFGKVMNKSAFVFLVMVTLSACAGAKTNDEMEFEEPDIIEVDVAVEGLKPDDEAKLEAELVKIEGVYNLRRDELGEATVFVFEYEGDFDRLRNRIESIEYPGLRRQKIVANLQYSGFDSRSPLIDIISPNTEEVITETSIEFVVEVEDSDVDSVTVNGVKAREQKPTIYHATIEVPEGEQEVKVVARDEAGNEATETATINVDTTPPEIEATVKVVVEGKVEPGSTVYVDGTQADVNMFGAWRVELKVKKGQKTVEVVAIDEAGNKRTEQKSIGL